MKSAKEHLKSIVQYINNHKLILASAGFMFIAMGLYLFFTKKRWIDADTAVIIPTFLIASMTIAWNIAHLWFKKRDDSYRLLVVIPAIFVFLGIGICWWLLKYTLSNITLLDWCRLFITPIITALIGIAQPMLNDIINQEEADNSGNKEEQKSENKKAEKAQKIVLTLLYIASFVVLCYTSWHL